MAKIVTILRSPLDVECPQLLLIDDEGDGAPVSLEEAEYLGVPALVGLIGQAPGLAERWYRPEDVQKWRDHFVGYTTETL